MSIFPCLYFSCTCLFIVINMDKVQFIWRWTMSIGFFAPAAMLSYFKDFSRERNIMIILWYTQVGEVLVYWTTYYFRGDQSKKFLDLLFWVSLPHMSTPDSIHLVFMSLALLLKILSLTMESSCEFSTDLHFTCHISSSIYLYLFSISMRCLYLCLVQTLIEIFW